MKLYLQYGRKGHFGSVWFSIIQKGNLYPIIDDDGDLSYFIVSDDGMMCLWLQGRPTYPRPLGSKNQL